jgi:HK97 family phage prohead protease
MVADFSGYVTKSGIKCSDGRVIMAHAFKGNDKQQVPLVWQHQHDAPDNVLGHVQLHNRDDGVWGEGFFNDTPAGQQAKALVLHKDINSLSIYANQLVQQAKNVVHGVIREVSLVLSGANPGAFIENINIAHGDDVPTISEEEAVIYSGELLEHGSMSTTVPGPRQIVMRPKAAMPAAPSSPDGSGPSVEDVFNTLSDEQKSVVYALVGATVQQGSTGGDDPANIPTNKKGEDPVTRNVFDSKNGNDPKAAGNTLSHSDAQEIFAAARKGGSLKEAVEEYALAHGIDDISTLFPYDQAVTDTPEFISRRTQWVAGVLSGTRKTPFSRIRSWTADITQDEARAKGYIKGDLKKEEFFAVAKRITLPQTIYKKQKLDRDDIIDITDFDVVTWLQTEMRVMLDEELARAILVGDGREVDDTDKINATNVRPIFGDDDMYVTNLNIDLSDAASSADEIVDQVVTAMRYYRGSGNPVLYTTMIYLSKMLLAKDTLGRRLYGTTQELSAALGVSGVVTCEALEQTPGLIGIIVNLSDYTIGADKGGQVSMFDFFDIDYNQFKYLMETRVSGAMTKYKGALTITEFTGAGGMLPNPTAPTFVKTTGVGTIPTTAHVTYVVVDPDDGSEGSALTAGAQTAIAAGESVHYRAKAASTYAFADDANEDWTFTRNAS